MPHIARTIPHAPPAAARTRLSVSNLADESRPRRAERGANRQLRLARGRARQQEVRQVGAGDQQDHADGSGQNPQGPPAVSHDLVQEGNEVGGQPLVLIRMGDGQPGHRGREVGASGGRVHSRRPAKRGLEKVRAAGLRRDRVDDPDGREEVRLDFRQPELGASTPTTV